MEIVESKKENGISRISREAGLTDSTERRNYDLNEEKAVKKKISATDRNVAEITRTGGGVKITLNTGAYELLKHSAEEFFSGDLGKYSSQIIPVKDKKGHVVETKFKVACGKSSVYTLNMYHTKSSCLVNGRQVQHFFDDHLPQLINAIEYKLDCGNMTVSDVNSYFRHLLCDCKVDDSANESTSSCHIKQYPSTLTSENTSDVTSKDANENVSTSCRSSSNSDKYMCLLESVAESVALLTTTLSNHIQMTDRNFNEIRDQIQSVKNQISCNSDHEAVRIDDINTSTEALKTAVNGNYDSLTRRLQQITDLVKNLPARCQNHVAAEKPSDEPVQSERESTVSEKSGRSERGRTLLVGDSLLKGIHPLGLHCNVDLKKISGAKVKDVEERLTRLNLGEYDDVIIHVGGNDVSGGKSHETSRRELGNITKRLQERHCKVHLCTVCPRQDVDVSEFNAGVRQICRETGADLLDCFQEFVNGNGEAVKPYFNFDGIHLSVNGSRSLVAFINRKVPIVRGRTGEKHAASQTVPTDRTQKQKQTNRNWRPAVYRKNYARNENRRYSH